MGVSKKSTERVAGLALERGLQHKDFSGSLSRYLDFLYLSHKKGGGMRIYNNQVFIFTKQHHLITVLDLPSKYHKVVKQVQDKQK